MQDVKQRLKELNKQWSVLSKSKVKEAPYWYTLDLIRGKLRDIYYEEYSFMTKAQKKCMAKLERELSFIGDYSLQYVYKKNAQRNRVKLKKLLYDRTPINRASSQHCSRGGDKIFLNKKSISKWRIKYAGKTAQEKT